MKYHIRVEGECHCDDTCSGMDLVGIVTVSHEEVERRLDEALKPDLSLKYNLFMYRLQDNHPKVYKVLISRVWENVKLKLKKK